MSLRIIEFLGNKQLGLEVWGSYVNLANGDKSIKMYDKQKRIYWFVNNWFWWVPDDDIYFFQVLVESKKNLSDDMTESDSKLKVLFLTIHDSVIMRYSHVQFKVLYFVYILLYFTVCNIITRVNKISLCLLICLNIFLKKWTVISLFYLQC